MAGNLEKDGKRVNFEGKFDFQRRPGHQSNLIGMSINPCGSGLLNNGQVCPLETDSDLSNFCENLKFVH